MEPTIVPTIEKANREILGRFEAHLLFMRYILFVTQGHTLFASGQERLAQHPCTDDFKNARASRSGGITVRTSTLRDEDPKVRDRCILLLMPVLIRAVVISVPAVPEQNDALSCEGSPPALQLLRPL